MHSTFTIEQIEEADETASDLEASDWNLRKRQRSVASHQGRHQRSQIIRPPRSEADQAFKCGHCKQFIGAPLTGGRHRNHCPNCLYSRHVDDTHPGDRRSICHAMMEPQGVLARRNGEQVIVHRCLGCGKQDPNRIAAADNPALLLTLPPVSPAGLVLVPDLPSRDQGEESA